MSANDTSIETLLRAHAPHAPERLRARVLAFEPAPRRSGRRRLALVALPAACVLAVAAALVSGALDSGNGGRTTAYTALTTPDAASHGGAANGPAVAGTPERKALAPAQSTGAGGAATPNVQTSRLAHTDASLRIRVDTSDELSAATTQATRIATSFGGYAKSVEYRSGGGGAAYVELRVPAQNVKVAIARLAGLGTVVSQQLSVTDLQDRFRTESAQIDQLRRRIAALRVALADPALPDAQKVLLRIRLAESKRALAQRTSARKGTIASGTTARISLVIGTKKAIAPVPHRSTAGRMLHSAVGFLALEGMVALYALIVLSPLALGAGLVILRRRRSIDRLLAAS